MKLGKVRPDKLALARMKTLSDLGSTPTAIAKQLGCSHHTTIKYLNRPEIFEDSQAKQLVQNIKETETTELYLLGAQARKRLHEILDNEKPKPIEATAIMDRTFQQRRLLKGLSTSNIAYADMIRARDAKLSELEQIEARLAGLGVKME